MRDRQRESAIGWKNVTLSLSADVGILFEKALKLAREGNMVIFVLHYSQITEDEDTFSDYAPLLLYHSLMNEISQEKAEVANKIKSCLVAPPSQDLI